MSGDAQGDITTGEIWRGVLDLRSEMASLGSKVEGLPAALAKELDDRSALRVDSLRTEIALRLMPLEVRVSRLERVMWGVIAFVFTIDGGALLALILKK